MKKRLLILVLPILLALALVTVALAAANTSAPGVAAGPAIPGSPSVAARVYQPARSAPQSPARSQPAGEQQGMPRSNSARIPGFLQADHPAAFSLPARAAAQVDAQGRLALPDSQAVQGSAASPQSLPAGFTVDLAYNAVAGLVSPGDVVTVSIGAAYGAAAADGSGFFWTPIWQPGGTPLDLTGGETIAIYVNGALADTVVAAALTGGMDVLTDQVSGVFSGLGAGVPLTVTIGGWGSLPADGAAQGVTTTTAGGSFLVDIGMDLNAGNYAQVDYQASGLSHVRSYLHSVPATFVIENFYLVAGYGDPGQDVAITVYIGNSSDVRWQGGGATNSPLGFYLVQGVDSQVGDVVEVTVGGSPAMTTTVANLHDISFDAAADQVSGTAPTGEDVLLYAYGWVGDIQTYMEAHVTAGPGDIFSASFAADLHASQGVGVFVTDGNGNSTAIWGGAPYIEALIDPTSNLDCLIGRVDAPNQPLTLSLQTVSGVYTRHVGPSGPGNEIAPPNLCFVIRDGDGNIMNFAPGDVLTYQSPGWSGSLTVADLSWQADTGGDLMTGSAPDGAVKVDLARIYSEQYPANGSATRQVSAAAGSFSADFSAFDLHDEDNVFLRHYDPLSDFVTQLAGPGFSGVKVHYFVVYAPWGVYGWVNTPNEYVSVSLYDETGNWLATSDGYAAPWDFWLANFQSNPFAPGYWITVTGDSGWQAGFQIPEITVNVDEAADLIWGEGPKDRLLLETSWGFNGFLPSDGYILDTQAYGHDLGWGDNSNVFYLAPSGDRFSQTKRWPFLVAHYGPYTAGNHVWGNGADFDAIIPVTVTDPGGGVIATAAPYANTFGDFDTSDLPVGSIAAGNFVYADFGAGGVESVEVLPISGEGNPETEIVTITAPAGTPFSVNADGPHGWWDSNWSNPDMVIGPSGYYTIDMSVDGYDLVPGTYFNVHTHQYHGHNTQYTFWLPVLNIRTNIGHEWVEGNFEAGHAIWITLTNSLGDIKATAYGETGPIPWWGGQSGFATNYNVPWQGLQPDIQAGDWVYASMDNGLYAESQLGVIEGVADVNADTVAGTISAPWYTESLHGDCSIWEDMGPGIGFDFDPDGGSFFCDFAGVGWDILPGHMIAVSYNEPDGDLVIDMAANPAPNLHIWTWADGQPAAGGNFLFNIQYRNDGDAPAGDAYITAVLDGGMTYLGDTSGIPVSGTGTPGDPLVWQLGMLEPNYSSDIRFSMFVTVTAAAGDWVTNTVHIDTTEVYDQDNPGEKDSMWSGQVMDNDTWIDIGKGAWTWDPVPGSQFVYNVNVCNHGSTASTEVVVTDTLPLSTTLLYWWGQQTGWDEVSFDSHQLVVSRPTLSGYSCGEIYLRVALDANAWPGMQLNNMANVYASSDLSPDDNWTSIWHNAGNPHTNLTINKGWNWGVLAPGGEIRYSIDYHNTGNLPAADVRITETLPASTTFRNAWWYDDVGGHPFTPTLVTDEFIVWEIGALDSGYGFNFEVSLGIDPQAPVGLELVNTADITRLEGEDTYDDNTSTVTEMVYGHGPNLRVRKTGDWHGHGEGHNAWYNINVENVGDMPAEHVTVTDTLPISMVLDGDPSTDWSQVEGYTYNPAEGWFTMTFGYLHPNWRRDININVYNPSSEPVIPGGLFFTNHAEITPVAGETTYADNVTEYTLASGPDLYVEKSLLAGEVLPGEVVTFSLLFGNRQVGHAWWWNLQGTSWLTDVLPAGTEFITASLRWCGDGGCPIDPMNVVGDALAWNFWPIEAGNWNEVYLTVRLTDTLTGLDTVENLATIASDQPEVDIEPDYANNTSVYTADVLLPYFTVAKAYTGNAVAGMPVTYTLMVDNLGHVDGSGVMVSDILPENLTYLSGGSYNPGTGEISWNLPSLSSGSSAAVAFTGQATCQAGQFVVNDTYRVEGSSEGVTSDWGAPVEFTVLVPEIEVSFQASSLAVLTGETVYFTGTATTNGTPLAYGWDFGGDGGVSGPVASHVFDTAGSYEVTLTVTDGCGHTAEYSLTVTVEAGIISVYLPVVRK